ncbi:sortase [Patescibacteria group bacterium]|nr:sortase [Patescibacteria group bacterium]MBU1015747.1 sortase [Patescibacteria group bacterium]MBU1938705.1 sortase [Patescibacteria group bacterium]
MSFTKRIFIGFLASVVLFGPPASARIYPDVPVNHKHNNSIAALTAKDTIQGYPNGEFHPDGLINRAEAVKILTRSKFAAGVIDASLDWHKQANHYYVMFPDVPIGEWYGKYVEISYQNQIVQGYPDGLFRPADYINFAEALKVILETYKVDLSRSGFTTNKLLYVNKDEWFEKYFTYAHDHNLINQNKFYHPGQLITRGEFVEIIYRLEEVLKNRLPAYVSAADSTSDEYKITIPKLDIINVDVNFASVYDPTSAIGILKYGLGNYLNPPDSKKKMLLFGHSSGYAWDHSDYKTILKEINRLSNGDRIFINYKEKGYVFEIFGSEIIPASQDHILVQNDNNNELTLYTCWPPNSLAQRYVVYGKPV